jgi:PAS domain-containing protein
LKAPSRDYGQLQQIIVGLTEGVIQSSAGFIRSAALFITDDSDEPDYLVLIVKDETERFEAEERFESAFNANPAPAIICRLSDLCYVRVNQGFLEMTGYARDDLAKRGAFRTRLSSVSCIGGAVQTERI